MTLPDGNTFDISGMWEMDAWLPMSDSVWINVPLDGAVIYNGLVATMVRYRIQQPSLY